MNLPSARHSFVLALVTTAMLLFHSGAFAIGPAYSGSWYNPQQSGHGFSLEYSVLNDGTPIVVVYWYVYDAEGNPIFLVGQGEPDESNSVTLEFVAPYGMKFGEFDPDAVVREDGGTGIFTFENSKAGVFDYEPSLWVVQAYGISAASIPVVQLLEVAHPTSEPPPTGEPVPLVGLWSGRMVYDRDYAGTATCYDADVLINSIINHFGDDYIDSISVHRDGGSTSSDSFPAGDRELILNNYVTGEFTVFSIRHEYTLRFNDYGQAEGTWRETSSGHDCYGTWSFLKE